MTTNLTNLTISPMITRNTANLRKVVDEHVAADAVIQGDYWDGHRGCFIGCLNHSSNPAGAEKKYGLPIMVQRIAEAIFERLPAEDAPKFFAALPGAIGCDGKDLSCVGWQFLAQVLRNMPLQPAEIQAVVDPVIAGLELLGAGGEWPAAAAFAHRADDAAFAADAASASASAAAFAADAASASASAAAFAADAASASASAAAARWAAAAANAADAAFAAVAANAAFASAAAQQRDLLLRLITDAPIMEGSA